MSAKGRTLRVGVFVVVGLLLATIAIFAIGDNRHVWERKVQYHAAFDDVGGLRPGAGVRMGGIDIGIVERVEHSDKADDNRGYVTLSVSRDEAVRIRKATVAVIETKSLVLGDKMLRLGWNDKVATALKEAGEKPDALVSPGGELKTVVPRDLMADAQEIGEEAKAAIKDLKKVIEGIADDRFKEDIRGTAHALREILEGISQKDGAAHRLIFDPVEGKRVDHILANLEVTTENLARVSENARDVSAQVKTGPGLAHTIFYDDQLANGMTGTMVELHNSLAAVRTGNGLAHSIVYGDEQTAHLMSNVAKTTEDLRDIVANLKAGRGTVGALLVDPTVYEDVKSLVGNVERNQVLRALVRYSIKQNEDKPHAEVKGTPSDSAPSTKAGK